jgi:hypothetical protein
MPLHTGKAYYRNRRQALIRAVPAMTILAAIRGRPCNAKLVRVAQ